MYAVILGAKRYSHIPIASCQVLIFYWWVNQSPHDSIAAHGASNPRPFGYESYALTNCAIAGYNCWYMALWSIRVRSAGQYLWLQHSRFLIVGNLTRRPYQLRLYPLINPAWISLTEAKVTGGIALQITETYKLSSPRQRIRGGR